MHPYKLNLLSQKTSLQHWAGLACALYLAVGSLSVQAIAADSNSDIYLESLNDECPVEKRNIHFNHPNFKEKDGRLFRKLGFLNIAPKIYDFCDNRALLNSVKTGVVPVWLLLDSNSGMQTEIVSSLAPKFINKGSEVLFVNAKNEYEVLSVSTGQTLRKFSPSYVSPYDKKTYTDTPDAVSWGLRIPAFNGKIVGGAGVYDYSGKKISSNQDIFIKFASKNNTSLCSNYPYLSSKVFYAHKADSIASIDLSAGGCFQGGNVGGTSFGNSANPQGIPELKFDRTPIENRSINVVDDQVIFFITSNDGQTKLKISSLSSFVNRFDDGMTLGTFGGPVFKRSAIRDSHLVNIDCVSGVATLNELDGTSISRLKYDFEQNCDNSSFDEKTWTVWKTSFTKIKKFSAAKYDYNFKKNWSMELDNSTMPAPEVFAKLPTSQKALYGIFNESMSLFFTEDYLYGTLTESTNVVWQTNKTFYRRKMIENGLGPVEIIDAWSDINLHLNAKGSYINSPYSSKNYFAVKMVNGNTRIFSSEQGGTGMSGGVSTGAYKKLGSFDISAAGKIVGKQTQNINTGTVVPAHIQGEVGSFSLSGFSGNVPTYLTNDLKFVSLVIPVSNPSPLYPLSIITSLDGKAYRIDPSAGAVLIDGRVK